MTKRYELAPNTLRNRVVAAAIRRAGGTLERIHYRSNAGFSMAAGMLASEGAVCTVVLNADSRFSFPLKDFYWNRILSPTFRYEPEIALALEWIAEEDFLFLDCGANYGFWSVLASSESMGSKETVAVEASRRNWDWAERNRELNGRQFVTVLGAISDKVGDTVELFDRGRHVGFSIKPEWNEQRSLVGSETVTTVTIDSLVEQYAAGRPVVVKLDVEGVEIEALRGAERCLSGEALVIYEDYAGDRTSAVTRFVMNDLGLKVFYLDENSKMIRVSDVDHATALKEKPTVGYNFYAATEPSSFFRLLEEKADASAVS